MIAEHIVQQYVVFVIVFLQTDYVLLTGIKRDVVGIF